MADRKQLYLRGAARQHSKLDIRTCQTSRYDKAVYSFNEEHQHPTPSRGSGQRGIGQPRGLQKAGPAELLARI